MVAVGVGAGLRETINKVNKIDRTVNNNMCCRDNKAGKEDVKFGGEAKILV